MLKLHLYTFFFFEKQTHLALEKCTFVVLFKKENKEVQFEDGFWMLLALLK